MTKPSNEIEALIWVCESCQRNCVNIYMQGSTNP